MFYSDPQIEDDRRVKTLSTPKWKEDDRRVTSLSTCMWALFLFVLGPRYIEHTALEEDSHLHNSLANGNPLELTVWRI